MVDVLRQVLALPHCWQHTRAQQPLHDCWGHGGRRLLTLRGPSYPSFACFSMVLQVLTAQNLASFSLVDCVQSLLGQTIEVNLYACL